MKDRAVRLGLTLCLSLTIPALTQTPENKDAAKEAATSATVANVYAQVANGVNVYNATATGKLTLVKGSPFPVSGQMEGVNGKYLISVGTNNLHSYPIASTGAIGKHHLAHGLVFVFGQCWVDNFFSTPAGGTGGGRSPSGSSARFCPGVECPPWRPWICRGIFSPNRALPGPPWARVGQRAR